MSDPEAAYYQAVEEHFVSRRGDPLFLSNADWLLVHRWREAGVPLRIVLRGINDALDGHAHSWGRRRKVGSLAYCEAAVDEARQRWQRALAYGLEEQRPVAEALLTLAAAVDAATGLRAAASVVAGELAREMRGRAGAPGEASELEAWLAVAERRLLDAIDRELPADRRPQLEAEIDAVLEPYANRMPPRVLARLQGDALARRLLAEHGLDRLTLFPLT